MTLAFEAETDHSFDFDPEALAAEVIEGVLDFEEFPYEAELSLTLVTEEAIRDLNRTYRRIDKATDVLSFPLLEYPAPGDFSRIDEEDDNFNPDSGEIMLGDIVISEPRVRAQAAAYGHSEKREYAFLIVHSMLHLLGYDHETAAQETVMKEKQDQILGRLEIFR